MHLGDHTANPFLVKLLDEKNDVLDGIHHIVRNRCLHELEHTHLLLLILKLLDLGYVPRVQKHAFLAVVNEELLVNHKLSLVVRIALPLFKFRLAGLFSSFLKDLVLEISAVLAGEVLDRKAPLRLTLVFFAVFYFKLKHRFG